MAYLLLPALLFNGGFLAPAFAIGATAAGLLAFLLSPGWRGGWGLPRRTTLACLAGGVAWAFGATGTHHLLHAAVDWQIRDVVLFDLARGGWPVAYSIGDLTWLLRAPLGYYLPAAMLGPALAEAGLFAWTAAGLAVVLLLLAALARDIAPGRRHAVAVVVLVFAAFGGMDLLPNIWLDTTQGGGLLTYWGRGGEWWARHFQYSGHVTLLLWAPNHALPAWIPALLLLRHARQPAFAGAAALPLATAAGWGPLSAIGAAALVGVAVLAAGRAGLWAALRGPANWLALGLAAPAALFLTAGSSAIPHGTLVAVHGWGAAPVTLLFLAVEVLAVALPVLWLLRSRLVAASVLLLCLLPLYIFGPGNEMTMRGGIAAFAVLAVAAGAALLRAPPGGLRRVLVAALAVGALGQGMEASILIHPPWPASRDCTLPEAAVQSVFTDTDWSHYVVPWPDARLRALLAEPEERAVDPASVARCWPDPAEEAPERGAAP
ncbi:hypothetical protein [Falsiroseomonas sp. CW058]|uniref:hypothetical protein n=1 Tax=Falsiroseomonas sp. CW058 TaxID=3388664 RepID=UPI003D31D7B4